MKPACLPEQLLCSADGAPPERASACVDGRMRGPVRAAFERAAVEPGARQHAARDLDMRRLAAMAGAGQRQFLVAEAVVVGRAALDQRQRLDRLHGRARIDRLRHVAERQHGRAVGIDHRDRAVMAALHQRAAHHLDQYRITHLSCRPKALATVQSETIYTRR